MSKLTPEEQEAFYGKDAREWLDRWDAGSVCWTIEMGGLGPGYEQCIHMTAAEMLRAMLAAKYDHTLWQDATVWKTVSDEIDKAVLAVPEIKALGLSGAQFGAALNIASALYMKGPVAVMDDHRVADRHIQVSKHFPGAAP